MKFLSLFSGIEAASVAWKPLGWECVGFSEIEPFPCAVLSHHYPDVPNLGDITQISEQDIKDLGKIDLIVFGFPCQNLSVAGNRKGLKGKSSGLFYEAIRIIEYARKHCGLRFALLENVPGAFSSNKGDDFREVVRELSANRDINTPENGWGNTGVALGENGLVEWRVLDAQYFGLAQRRKRVFAIVDFGNWMDRPPILLEPKSLCGDTPPSREKGKEIAADTQTSVGSASAYSIIADATPKIGEDVCGTLRSQGGGGIVPPSVVYGLNSQQPPARLTEECCETLVASNYKEPMGVLEIFKSNDRVVGALCARDYKGVGNQYVSEGKLVVVHGSQDPITSETTAYGFDTKQHQPKIERELTQTLVATDYKEAKENVIAIAGNIIGRSPQNGGNGNGFDEEVCYTLTTADRHAVAFQTSYNNLSVKHEISQPILAAQGTTGNKGVNVCYIPTTADRRALAFQQNTRDEVRLMGENGQIAGALSANAGMKQQNYIYELKTLSFKLLSSNSMKSANYPCPSKNQGGLGVLQFKPFREYTDCLYAAYGTKWNGNGAAYNGSLFTHSDSIIRRLTPMECERLQGFPDAYTKIPYRKKDIDQCPDSPRYKALGNSMAVPVMQWIGKQIQKAAAA